MKFKHYIASLVCCMAFGANLGAAGAAEKTLVVYYSSTGYTQKAAETVAHKLNADLFRIVADPDYSSADLDYNNPQSRVSRENADLNLRGKIKLAASTPENFGSYKRVVIGYPIWWGIAAFPVETFVKANNFEGKEVYTFCTSYSSPLGESDVRLAKQAGAGNWHPGIRFRYDVDKTELEQWIASLKL